MRARRAGVVALATAPLMFVGVGVATAADSAAAPASALSFASAWHDALGAHRAPRRPDPGPTERLIVALDDPASVWVASSDRAAALQAIDAAQAALAPQVAALGGSIVGHHRVILNALVVEVPNGRADAVASLDGVRAVTPIAYLSPATVSSGAPHPAVGRRPARLAPGGNPVHIAVIDTAVDAGAPQLGGGIGPRFPIIGGADLVDADGDPTAPPDAPTWESHGTQMVGILLGSPELTHLKPARRPRIVAYRVVSAETVGGVVAPVAPTDRVITALERAADPNGDGAVSDHAEVVLLGVAGAFGGGRSDPLARALAGVERAGSVVVAPVGNDGATRARTGSVGLPASAPSVLAVGAIAADLSPPTAQLQLGVGPAAARLDGLPLLGSPPSVADMAVVALPGPEGLSTGTSPDDYAQLATRGVSLRGSIVMVERGGGTFVDRARLAAQAGAAAVLVWDRTGDGVFPSATGDGGPVIPVLGAGPTEGQALLDLLAHAPDLTARMTAAPRRRLPAAIASFSSTGPTVDGRIKPDLVAAGVDVPAPWSRAVSGAGAQSAPATGTSPAAARVAAIVSRTRVERPGLTPSEVRAVVVGGARPLTGVAARVQGAGRAGPADSAPIALVPPVVTATGTVPRVRVSATIVELSGKAGGYHLAVLSSAGRPLLVGPRVRVAAGARLRTAIELPVRPHGWSGRVAVITDKGSRVVVEAPAATYRRLRSRGDAVGVPVISKAAGLTQAEVRIGVMSRSRARVRNVPVGEVRVRLIPDDGSASLLVAGVRSEGDWVPGTYRFVLSRRLPTGGEVPTGRYRLRVTGRTPDGRAASATSAAFVLGEVPPNGR